MKLVCSECGYGADPGTGVRSDLGVVELRCANGTSGAARVGVVQALAGCGENYDLPMLEKDAVQFLRLRSVIPFLIAPM